MSVKNMSYSIIVLLPHGRDDAVSKKIWQAVSIKRETAEQREMWEFLKVWSHEHGVMTRDYLYQEGYSEDDATWLISTLVTTPSEDGFWSMEGDLNGFRHHRVTPELCEAIFQAGKRVQARQREWDAYDLAKEMGVSIGVAWHYDRILMERLQCPIEFMRFMTGAAWPRQG
jgi:hypothetical protein